MLERLDNIPWRKYDDAYGPSVATPGPLRALVSDNPKKREKAPDELSYNIYHQGTVYEATIYVVPFLLEMLAEPSYGGKAPVLELMQMLAEGTSYHDVHQHLSFMEEKAKTEEYQATVEKEKGWVAQVKAEILKGLPILLSLLKDPDQHAVGLLLVLFGDKRGPWRREDLSPLQRRGIIAVAKRAFPKRNSVFVNFSDVLRVFNLPGDRGQMERLIGQELPMFKPRGSSDKPWWKFW